MSVHHGSNGKIMVRGRTETKFHAAGLITDFSLNLEKRLHDSSIHTSKYRTSKEGLMRATGNLVGWWLMDSNPFGQKMLHEGVLNFPANEIRLRLYVDEDDVLFYDFPVSIPRLRVDGNYERVIPINISFSSNGIIEYIMIPPKDLYSGQITISSSPTQIETDYQPIRSLTIKADQGNAGDVYIMDIDISSTKDYPLSPNNTLKLSIDNLSIVYVDADNLGDEIHYLGVG